MADLTVRGAGIFGLAIAWVAIGRGANVTVIDPNGPGAGSSGGVVGALQPHTPNSWNTKKQFQLESLLSAPKYWAGVEQASGIASGYSQVGRLQPLNSQREVELAKSRVADAKTNWRDQAKWEVLETEDLHDWRPPSLTGLYVHDTLSAIIHPRRAIESLAAAIISRGGSIKKEGPNSGPIVWATGWQGILDLNTSSGTLVGNGVKGQAALLAHDAIGRAQVFAENLHIIPHSDGTVGVGSTSERNFSDGQTTDYQVEELVVRAGEILPVLRGARVIERWAGVRPRAASRAPILGAWPKRPNHYVANGGFKIGFGMAPKVARTICDLVLDDSDTIPDEFRLKF